MKGGFDAIRVKTTATNRYNDEIKAAMKSTIWVSGCESWYLDADGNSATWPWTPKKFRQDLSSPLMNDFELLNTTDSNSVLDVEAKESLSA